MWSMYEGTLSTCICGTVLAVWLRPPFVVPGSASLPRTMRTSAAHHIIVYHGMLALNSPILEQLPVPPQ